MACLSLSAAGGGDIAKEPLPPVVEASPTEAVDETQAPAHAEQAGGESKAKAANPIEVSPGTPLVRPPKKAAEDSLAGYQRQLEKAREHRRMQEHGAAEKILMGLLESRAPDELKRPALIELALTAQEQKDLPRAQQVFSQYVRRYPEDFGVPAVLLRQGLMYREMGAPVLAISKFYSVMSSALRLKLDQLDYYQRLVLQAQAEIADTYYLQGKYEEAIDFFNRLLRLNNADLDRPAVQVRLIRSLAAANRETEAVSQARMYLGQYGETVESAEVRYLLVAALKRLGQRDEALKVVQELLVVERRRANPRSEATTYWQQRTGNELANELYQQGDFVNALVIYDLLAEADDSPNWRLPAWYQAGLIHERCAQPARAVVMYDRILERAKALDTNAPPSISLVVDMARWRRDRLQWQDRTDEVIRKHAPADLSHQVSAAKP